MDCLPSSSDISTIHPNRIRLCAVCGDSPAKIHYGVLACFGCKGFFRRAVKDGRNKYVCRYEKKCAVNKYERNSCRYCRFRRCLQVGMNPDAVRPDRETAKESREEDRNGIPKKKSLGRTNSNKAEETDDWTRFLTPEQRTLLMQLLNLENTVENSNEQSYENVSEFTLKSLVADRMLGSNPSSRSSDPTDNSFTSIWRVVSVVDWIEGVIRLTEGGNRHVVTTALVQSSFSALSLYTLSIRAAASAQNDSTAIQNVLEPCNRSFSKDISRRSFSELILPLRTIAPSDVEYVLLKTIIVLNPDACGLCNSASQSLREQRDMVQELLFKTIKKSRPKSLTQPASHFGNLLLLLPSLRHLGNDLNSFYSDRFIRGNGVTFAPFQRILMDVFNPERDDLLLQRDMERSDVEQQSTDRQSYQKEVNGSEMMPPPSSVSFSAFSPGVCSLMTPPMMPPPSTSSGCASSCFYTPPPYLPRPSPLPPSFSSRPSHNDMLSRPSSTISRPSPLPPSFSSRPSHNDMLSRPSSLSVCKLPLQLTRSIEEMLRPAGMADDPSLNRPLTSDWADTVGYSTPVFNRDVVSQFFPEIISQNNQQ